MELRETSEARALPQSVATTYAGVTLLHVTCYLFLHRITMRCNHRDATKTAESDSLGPSQSAGRSSRAFCGAHNDGPTTDDPKLMADSRCLTIGSGGCR